MKIAYSTKIALSGALVLALSASCAPAPRAGQRTTADPGPSVPKVLVAQTVSSPPWYVPRLQALGFSVFSQPQDLDPILVEKRDGGAFDLATLKGKVVLLNFWATWCGPCRSEMPSIEKLWKSTRGTSFTVVAVSVGEKPGTVESFLKANPYGYPVYLDKDGSVSSSFVTEGIPSTYLLDKQGRFIARIVGSRSYDTPEVVGLMKELAEKLP